MLNSTFSYFPFSPRPNLAIDLGNKNTVLWHEETKTFFSATTAVAFKNDFSKKTKIFATGQRAIELEGRVTSSIEVVHPVTGGMVTNVDAAAHLLADLVANQTSNPNFVLGNTLISAPATATEIEKKAFVDVAVKLKARNVYLIPEPMAAAIGCSLDVLAPRGRCVVDVGDGIVEAVLISMCEIVSSFSLRLDERSFETCLLTYLREAHNFHISKREAERTKILLASPSDQRAIVLNGFCSRKNLPAAREFLTTEFRFIQERCAADVTACVLTMLENAPAELSSDLTEDGILLTGGNSLNPFLIQYLQKALGIHVMPAANPLLAVSFGNQKALQDKRLLSSLRAQG